MGKTEENLRSRSAVQATIITDMKIGSMENLNHSTESIPTKNTNRKKRAQERSRNQTTNQQSSDDDVATANKDTLKSKSQIINSDPLNPERAKRKKKKKKDGTKSKKDEKEEPPETTPAESKPIKGYKDFNQLQAEMKQREKELKKKLKTKGRKVNGFIDK